MESKKKIQFYHYQFCPYCKPVNFLLISNNIPHDAHNIDLPNKKHLTPEFKAVNPFQRVPTLIDDGFIIYESNTVMRYIANTYKVEDHWYPKDSQKRAMVDLFFDWFAANINKVLKYPMVKARYVQDTNLDAALIETRAALSELCGMLTRNKYVASIDKLTIADLALVYHLYGFKQAKIDLSEFKIIDKYFEIIAKEEPKLMKDIEEYMRDVQILRADKATKEKIVKMKEERRNNPNL